MRCCIPQRILRCFQSLDVRKYQAKLITSCCELHIDLLVISRAFYLVVHRVIILVGVMTLYVFVYNKFCLVNLPWDHPGTWYFCFIGVDFLYYWFHRAAHEVNIMWAAHQAHHSSEDYNLTTALRQSVVQNYTSAVRINYLTCHFTHIWKTLWEMPGTMNKLSVIFQGPGWKPGKPRLGDPGDIPEVENPIRKYDSCLSSWGNLYVLVHFVVAIVAYQMLIARRM
ncbi:PREDICTED: alkylglycerol monooxygenase-like, partial [Acropora digitifera]|uniref:alkylglycerol monooxygenase-like n=1 Tax=Acropora digitifera TaxID=70779 RepID=UPI00077AC2A1